MNRNDFCIWIEKYLKKHDINKLETFDIEVNGEKRTFSIKNIIEIIKMTSESEQKEIKKMLEKITDSNSNIEDYFMCLAAGFCYTFEESSQEENEEAM